MLEISAETAKPGVGIVTLLGRFTINTIGDRLDSTIRQLLDQGCKTIIIDLAGVTHLDSTGIGKFIQYLNLIMGVGGKLSMAGAQPTIRESFRVTRLDTVFRFYDSVETALEA